MKNKFMRLQTTDRKNTNIASNRA